MIWMLISCISFTCMLWVLIKLNVVILSCVECLQFSSEVSAGFNSQSVSTFFPAYFLWTVSTCVCSEWIFCMLESSITGLCDQFSSLFDQQLFLSPSRHELTITYAPRPPCSASVRRLSPEKLEILRNELNNLLALGVIEKATALWEPLSIWFPSLGGNGGWPATTELNSRR